MPAAVTPVALLAVAAPEPTDEPPAPADRLGRAGRDVRDFETVINDQTDVQRERQSQDVNSRNRVSNTTRTINPDRAAMEPRLL